MPATRNFVGNLRDNILLQFMNKHHSVWYVNLQGDNLCRNANISMEYLIDDVDLTDCHVWDIISANPNITLELLGVYPNSRPGSYI